ncbi:MAG TPA: site-specific integrase [Phycisphaerae bacterium]|nr:site-specific integrase [Phycisphaerae bacterium]
MDFNGSNNVGFCTTADMRLNGLIDPKVDRIAAAESKSPAEHLAAFRTDIGNRNGNYAYASQVHQRAERIINYGGIVRLSQLKPAAINTAIAKLREDKHGKAKDGNAKYGKTSVAHHLRAIKMFSRWLCRNGQTADDSLLAVKIPTVAASDRKIYRRALSQAEFDALVTFTVGVKSAYGMSGKDRAMLYAVAGSTGFRQGELRTLTPESFVLDDSPTITVKAAYSKRRRDDRQPIPFAMSTYIKPWLSTKVAGKTVFKMPPRFDVADMIRADLENAREQWLKEAEKNPAELSRRQQDNFLASDGIDFHALRVSYISWLVQSGASVKTCQELARHSTPVLTIGLYARMSLNDQDNALASLPVPGGAKTEDKSATGTDDE